MGWVAAREIFVSILKDVHSSQVQPCPPQAQASTPNLGSGQVLPLQSRFLSSSSLYTGLRCSFRGRASPPRQSYRCLASCHADMAMWQHKGAGQSERQRTDIPSHSHFVFCGGFLVFLRAFATACLTLQMCTYSFII